MNRRSLALQAFLNLLQGQSLDDFLRHHSISTQDETWIYALVEGCARHYIRLRTLLKAALLHHPLPPQDHDIECVLVLALYELTAMRSKVYAVLNEWVDLADTLKKSSYKAVINAICRRYDREKESLNWQQYPNNPSWLLKKYRKHYSTHFHQLLAAEDQDAPLFLRINIQKISRSDYQHHLENSGIQASPDPHLDQCLQLRERCAIPKLPGYQEGWFYVQDASAQWAAELLDAQAHHFVLDVCAAPGGKTLHLLERDPSLHIVATDSSSTRLNLIQDNLNRCNIGTNIQLLEQDMTTPSAAHFSTPFDRILLDAPCSGTGVIRRHPEIKLLRNTEDIKKLQSTQKALLQGVWPLLKTGGYLLYSTCSILPEENEEIILDFLNQHPNAKLAPLSLPTGLPKCAGWQILPEINHGDGFYYAKIFKH